MARSHALYVMIKPAHTASDCQKESMSEPKFTRRILCLKFLAWGLERLLAFIDFDFSALLALHDFSPSYQFAPSRSLKVPFFIKKKKKKTKKNQNGHLS
jgi:hypothetical protein